MGGSQGGQCFHPSAPTSCSSTHTHPFTKLSDVPPDLAAVRFLASLIQTWSSPPSPVLPGKTNKQTKKTEQDLTNFHHCFPPQKVLQKDFQLRGRYRSQGGNSSCLLPCWP